jgi:Fe2+ or Zn2+ uptake regulation protein
MNTMKKTIGTLPQTELKHLFNKTGLRFTPQREAVWRLFESDSMGLTISQAIVILAPQRVGQATVYRTIKALQDMGYLKWVHDQSGEHRFIASRPEHSHMLVCRSCSKAVESSDCDLSVLEKLIASQTGFTVEGHYLEFFGLCRECSSSTPDTLA